jgi:nicotinamidase-related amidase
VFANAGALGVADGYEVYFLTDASSGASREAHDMAVQRVIEGGDPDSDRVLCQRIAA